MRFGGSAGGLLVIKADVKPTMRQGVKKVFVALEPSGTVLGAWCSCEAGYVLHLDVTKLLIDI